MVSQEYDLSEMRRTLIQSPLDKAFHKFHGLVDPQYGYIDREIIRRGHSPCLIRIIIIVSRTGFISLLHHVLRLFHCHTMPFHGLLNPALHRAMDKKLKQAGLSRRI